MSSPSQTDAARVAQNRADLMVQEENVLTVLNSMNESLLKMVTMLADVKATSDEYSKTSTINEFDRRYPPDQPGEETSDKARVWKMYRDHAVESDATKLANWNRTLDILLIFGGLFSAVVTAFLIEGYKLLQPDFTEYATLAYIAVNTGTPIPHPEHFEATLLARWINGLWFTSVSLALLTTLLAIMTKQWLTEFGVRIDGHTSSHRRWVWRHMFLSKGLHKWGIDMFISILPQVMHLALTLFFVGLILFLWKVDIYMATFLTIGSGCAFAMYIAAFIMPLLYGDCPTVTPLLRQTHRLYGRIFAKNLKVVENNTLPPPAAANDPVFRHRIAHVFRNLSDWFSRTLRVQLPYTWQPTFEGMTFLTEGDARRDAHALRWMVANLPSIDQVHLAIDCIGSLYYPSYSQYFATTYDEDGVPAATIRSMCINRFVPLSQSDFVDPAPVTHSVQTMLFLGIQESEVGIPDIYWRAWRRWKREDNTVETLARYLRRSEEYLDDLPVYLDDPSPSTPSMLMLLLRLHKVPSAIRPMAYLYRGGVNAFESLSGSTQTLMLTVLAEIAERLETTLTARMIAAGVRDVGMVVVGPERDVRIRVARLAGFALEHRSALHIDPVEEKALAILFDENMRFCHVDYGDFALSLDEVEVYFSYLASDDFMERHWDMGLVSMSVLLRSLVSIGATYWSPAWGTIIRRVFHKIQQDELLKSCRIPILGIMQDAGVYDSCADAAIDLQRHSSLESAIEGTRLNLLVRDNLAQSAWRTVCMVNQPVAAENMMRDLTKLLLQLDRSDMDISALMDELLHGLTPIQLLTSDVEHSYGFDIARHLKEISEEVWTAIENGLLSWGPNGEHVLDDNFDPATFIASVNQAGPCTDCPARISFSA